MKKFLQILCSTIAMTVLFMPAVTSAKSGAGIDVEVDKTIIVIRAGKTPRDYILKSIQAIQSNKVMGIVLNGVELGFASKYYYYSNNHD